MAAGLAGLAARPCAAYPSIEAVKGKHYKLTKKHGPWMIMVASFHETPKEFRTEGMSPEEAAEELVFELRKKGIPAYTFSQKEVVDNVRTTDRMGRARSQSFIAQKGSVCILAGNYEDAEDSVATRTLSYIKKFRPEFIGQEKGTSETSFTTNTTTGVVYHKSPGRPNPFSGAFLTLNPLLTPEEVAANKTDPLLTRLNAQSDYSLLQNQKKYTVVVASYYGNSSKAQLGHGSDESDRKFKISDSLDYAGQNAYQVCLGLRQGKYNLESDPNKPPRLKAFEAYVYHDRTRSIVTVGGFDRPDDPEIIRIIEQFRAKRVQHPTTRQEILAAEKLVIPPVPPESRRNDPTWKPLAIWIFDPQPTVMAVPRLKK